MNLVDYVVVCFLSGFVSAIVSFGTMFCVARFFARYCDEKARRSDLKLWMDYQNRMNGVLEDEEEEK